MMLTTIALYVRGGSGWFEVVHYPSTNKVILVKAISIQTIAPLNLVKVQCCSDVNTRKKV